MSFPTKNDHFGVFWGYHYFRKQPFSVVGSFFGGGSWKSRMRFGRKLPELCLTPWNEVVGHTWKRLAKEVGFGHFSGGETFRRATCFWVKDHIEPTGGNGCRQKRPIPFGASRDDIAYHDFGFAWASWQKYNIFSRMVVKNGDLQW